jgi:hypothetical protein
MVEKTPKIICITVYYIHILYRFCLDLLILQVGKVGEGAYASIAPKNLPGKQKTQGKAKDFRHRNPYSLLIIHIKP